MTDKKKRNPFDYITSLTSSKKDLSDDLSGYAPFVVNRAFSLSPSTILLANEMNRRSELPIWIQYGFYMRAVPKQQFRPKWPQKKAKDELIENRIQALMKFHNISMTEARRMLELCDPDEVDRLVKIYFQ